MGWPGRGSAQRRSKGVGGGVGPRAGWWYLRPDPRRRVVSPLLREGQGVKLCSLLSKCPLSCLLPASLPSARLRSGPGGRRRPELETTLSAASAPRRPWHGRWLPGDSRGPDPSPMARPARALLVPSAAGPVLPLLSGVGCGGLGKNASSDPRGPGMGLRVRGLRSSELRAVGGTVAPGRSGLLGLRAAWAGKVERRL